MYLYNVQRLNLAKTPVSTFTIFGEADGALTLSVLERTHKVFTVEYQQAVLPKVGYFLPREAPEEFAKLVMNFINN